MHARRLAVLTALLACCATAPAAAAAPGKAFKGDRDRDGLADRHELLAGTDPARPDSDGDGIKDGREGAGRIVARRGDRLVLRLFGGGAVRARLTAATEVACPEPEAAEDEVLDEADVPLEEDVAPDPLPAELQSLPGGDAEDGEQRPADEEHAEEEPAGEGDAEEEPAGCGLDDLRPGTVVSESAVAGRAKRRRWASLALAT